MLSIGLPDDDDVAGEDEIILKANAANAQQDANIAVNAAKIAKKKTKNALKRDKGRAKDAEKTANKVAKGKKKVAKAAQAKANKKTTEAVLHVDKILRKYKHYLKHN